MAFDATDFQPATVDPLTITEPKERLAYLRDFLRELPRERFNMLHFGLSDGRYGYSTVAPVDVFKECGTAACICGWTNVLFGGRETDDEHAAAHILGLDIEASENLFYPHGWGSDLWSVIPPSAAVAVLDHLIATGEVDWSVARKAEA